MGNLSTVQPRTIVAKVAERLGEIDAARERGVTWRSIAEAIGDAVGISPSSSAGRRLRIAVVAAHRAVEKGRLRPRPAGAVPARPVTQGQPPQRAGRGLPGPEFFEQLKQQQDGKKRLTSRELFDSLKI